MTREEQDDVRDSWYINYLGGERGWCADEWCWWREFTNIESATTDKIKQFEFEGVSFQRVYIVYRGSPPPPAPPSLSLFACLFAQYFVRARVYCELERGCD